MSKKFSKFMAGLMAALMVGSILPTEYLTSFAVDTDKNSIKFVDTQDEEVYIKDSNASIKAETYQKDISLKVQFDYSIDYSTNESYDVGEMVYYMPSWGYYENDIGANYIVPDNISVNNGSDIWEYETTTLKDSNGGERVVLKISNKVELTSNVVTSGYMQFGLTMNARNVCNGSKFLTNNITILAFEDGGKTGKQLNSLTWDVTTYLDEFNLQENVADVSVANASDLGSDADDYYWAKYTIDASVAKLKTTPATGFQLDITIPEGAILYSVNGDKDSTGTITFDLDDWNYTSSETAKTFTVFVKYPKSKFNGGSVTPSSSLKALYNGKTEYVEVATSQVTHELHDYDVKYDGDLFAVNTSANKGYEISWNSLNRNEASPFSFYMSALSNYASEDGYGMIIFDDALEILKNNGTFERLSDEDYEFTSVTIYDLSHFTNSSGDAYTSLEYVLLDQDNQVISGTNGNVADITSSNGKTITLPSGTTNVNVYFPDLTSTLYLDSSAIKVNGVINPTTISATDIMQEGQLRNLVGLFAIKDSGNGDDGFEVMNIVEKDNYVGVDADRLAQADLDNFGIYVQRDLDSIKVVYKSSQINVETSFDPSTSTYDEENDVQTSTLTISSFFAAPGEVESFSVFDILPEGMEFDKNDITYSISKATNSPSTITLKDGTVITADNADAYIAKHATVKLTSDYKGSGRTLVTIDFDFSDNAVCYDATSDNGFTSGKIVANLPVQVENKDATYDNIAALIFNDEHSETILKTTDNGEAPLVKAESSLWTDINGNGKVDEIVDYASATLTSIYTEADNVKENPSIKITKTADKDVYQNGETIVYTIVVTNNGDVALTGVKVTETLDGAFDAQDGVTTNGKVATIGDLAIGASVTLTYKVAVPANSKDGDTVKNVVSVTSNEKASDEAKKDVTIEVPTTSVTNPSVKITKTADKDVYQNGETIVYTIVVTNNGDVALTGVKVTETLDGAFDAQDGVTINGKVATIGDLAVGASVTLTYKVAVPANSKDGDTVKNVVSVTSNEKASDEAKKDVTIEVPTTTTNPSIKITKTADKDVYQNGETIVYTIVVTNNGDVALTGVKVTETLDGAFDAQDGVTINGKVATIGDLAVGASVTLTYKVAVPANSKDGDTVKNVVSVTSNEKASDEAKKDVTIEVPTTTTNPSVKITKTADKDVYQNGETIVYTIVVTNNGDVALTGVKVTETLDGAFDAKDGVTTNGKVATIGDLAIGASVTLTYKVAVPANSKDGDTVKNVVSVTSNEKASDEAKKDITIEVPTTTTNPSVKITKTSDKETYKNGETIVYTIKVTNNGDVALTGVKVTETLDGSFVAQDRLTIDGKTATIANLAVGETVSMTFKVAVPANSKDGAVIKNVVSVTTNEKATDTTEKDVNVEVPVTFVSSPSLEIVKTADKATYNPGETVTYTIKVTNNGNVDLTNVNVVETLNGKWANVSSNVTVKDDKNAVISSLKIGASETLTYTYVISEDASNNASIKNIVKANESTYNLNVSDDVTITVKQIDKPSLDITKTADKKAVKAGETITYTIVVTNNGNVDLTNISVIDSLTSGSFAEVSDVTRVNDYSLIIPTLKVGESRTFTFTYVVDKDTTATSIENVATAYNPTYNLTVSDKVNVTITKSLIETIPEVVQTGDNAPMFLFLGLAIIALIGMCVVTKISSKKKNNK